MLGLKSKLLTIGGALLAGLLVLWRLVTIFTNAGVDKQKAKEAEARAKNLERIKDAIAAGDRPVDSMSDRHNRDNG